MAISAKGMKEQSLAHRLLIACGAIGPLFFFVVFLIESATRADYSPLRQPVSSLSIGDLGWMQQANFIITGLLLFAFSIGLWQRQSFGRWGPLLIGLGGIGLIGAGIFITDPVNGYPPGTPLVPVVRTTHGKLHDLFGVMFLGLSIAGFVFARCFAKVSERGWAIYSVFSGIGMFVAVVLTGMGLGQVTTGLGAIAGVFQRLALLIGFGWIAMLAVYLLRQVDDRP